MKILSRIVIHVYVSEFRVHVSQAHDHDLIFMVY